MASGGASGAVAGRLDAEPMCLLRFLEAGERCEERRPARFPGGHEVRARVLWSDDELRIPVARGLVAVGRQEVGPARQQIAGDADVAQPSVHADPGSKDHVSPQPPKFSARMDRLFARDQLRRLDYAARRDRCCLADKIQHHLRLRFHRRPVEHGRLVDPLAHRVLCGLRQQRIAAKRAHRAHATVFADRGEKRFGFRPGQYRDRGDLRHTHLY